MLFACEVLCTADVSGVSTAFVRTNRPQPGKDPGFSEGGRGVRSDKRPPTLANCYCYLTSPFSQEKVWSKYLRSFHLTLGGSAEPPLDPPQHCYISTSATALDNMLERKIFFTRNFV